MKLKLDLWALYLAVVMFFTICVASLAFRLPNSWYPVALPGVGWIFYLGLLNLAALSAAFALYYVPVVLMLRKFSSLNTATRILTASVVSIGIIVACAKLLPTGVEAPHWFLTKTDSYLQLLAGRELKK